MKMDRNINDDGLGKYAVINLRRLQEVAGSPSTFERWTPAVAEALRVLSECGALEWGHTGEQDEFFLIKLKDRHAPGGLNGYADSHAASGDLEFAREVRQLAHRSGPSSPFCKEPD